MNALVASSLVVALACVATAATCVVLTLKARRAAEALRAKLAVKDDRIHAAYVEVADLQGEVQSRDERIEALQRQVAAYAELRTEQEGIIGALKRELKDGPSLSAPGTIF